MMGINRNKSNIVATRNLINKNTSIQISNLVNSISDISVMPAGTIEGQILYWDNTLLTWVVTDVLKVDMTWKTIAMKLDNFYMNSADDNYGIFGAGWDGTHYNFQVRQDKFVVTNGGGTDRVQFGGLGGSGSKLLGIQNAGFVELIDYPTPIPVPALIGSILVSDASYAWVEKLFDGTGVRLLEVLADGTIQPLTKTAASIPVVATGFTHYLNATHNDVQKLGTALDNIPIYVNPNKNDIRTTDLSWTGGGARTPLTISIVAGTYEIEFFVYIYRSTLIGTTIEMGLSCSDTGVTNIKGIIDGMDPSTYNSYITDFNGNLNAEVSYNWGGGSTVNVKAKSVVTFTNDCDLAISIKQIAADAVACKTGSWLKAIKL